MGSARWAFQWSFQWWFQWALPLHYARPAPLTTFSLHLLSLDWRRCLLEYILSWLTTNTVPFKRYPRLCMYSMSSETPPFPLTGAVIKVQDRNNIHFRRNQINTSSLPTTTCWRLALLMAWFFFILERGKRILFTITPYLGFRIVHIDVHQFLGNAWTMYIHS